MELNQRASRAGNTLANAEDADARKLRELVVDDNFERIFVTKKALLGLASTVSISWQNQPLLVTIALTNGGRAAFVWGSLVVFILMTLLYHTFREKVAAWPVAAGQYFWIGKTAPKHSARFLSFMSGWILVWAWQAFQTAGVVLIGTFVTSLVYMWTGTAAYWIAPTMSVGTALVIFLVNRFFTRALAKCEPYMFLIHILAAINFLVITPVLQYRIGQPLASGREIFGGFENLNGWSSVGGAACLSAVVPFSSALGYDSIVHMSQEVKDAAKLVPAAMMISNVLNFTLAWLASIITALCTPDVSSLIGSPLAQSTPNGAFLQIFLSATGSKVGATLLSLPIALTIFMSCCNSLACSSRELWAFAADGGFPLSRWLGKSRELDGSERGTPQHAIMFSMICPVSFPLIGLRSTAALNATISLVVACLSTSYLIVCTSSLCFRCEGGQYPQSKYTMGRRTGVAVEAVSVLFLTAGIVVSLFPGTPNPSLTSMNYAVVPWSACLLLGILYWFLQARMSFKSTSRHTESTG
ncbi:hypothetical protein LTR86_010401 [Recurvomyces mirabilis]|nr:hypothetical protein LTR86_010401 [Recurvomyces mirabilis]